MIQKTARLWWVALLVGWCFDFLFWDKNPGVSFLIFVVISLGAGLWLSYQERKLPSRKSLILLLPILIFAAGTFFRQEPFTIFTNVLLALLLMALFTHTFLGGRWLNYSLSDFVVGFFYLIINTITKPVQVFWMQKEGEDEDLDRAEDHLPGWKRYLPVLRGLLLAIPILLVFGSLLAAADPIFSGYVEDLVGFIQIENLPEYLVRGFIILIIAYLLSGIYAYAILDSRDEKLIGLEKPWMPRFLGITESGIIIFSVDILFTVFVVIQFTYFFGGQSNIHLEGYTYAEYARRGFGELLVVAFFSLLLFLGLSAITRRDQAFQRKVFSGLGVILMLLVNVILVSAFQRLLLYESAYGYTRLRSYSHIFMVWLGLLLVFVVLLEIWGKQRIFALAALTCAVGFVVTINILNVDGTIVEQNIRRTELGWELDVAYLDTLTVDATPALLEAYQGAQIQQSDRNSIGAILACQKEILTEKMAEQSWQSYHWSDGRALRLLDNLKSFEGVEVYQDENDAWWVDVNGETRVCSYTSW